MNKIAQDFKSTILSSEAVGLAKDYTEIALDSMLNDGLLKDIPIIGSVIGIFKIGSTIRENHTIRKIATFLNCLENIPEDEKADFFNRLEDEDKNGELFEKLLIIIDRLDETIKAEMIGNLFRMYVTGVFSKMMFLRCCAIIEQAFVPDLVRLHVLNYYRIGSIDKNFDRFDAYKDNANSKISEQNLVNLGVKTIKYNVKKSNSRTDSNDYELQPKAELNEVGRVLAAFIFYDLNEEQFKRHMNERKDIYQKFGELNR